MQRTTFQQFDNEDLRLRAGRRTSLFEVTMWITAVATALAAPYWIGQLSLLVFSYGTLGSLAWRLSKALPVSLAFVLAALCSACNSQAPPTISSNEAGGTAATARVDFTQEVLPILERSCFPCHGPKMSPVSMAGFRVDLREHAVGRDKIVPGDPDESLLIRRLITKQDSERMPPLKSDNPRLNAEQIDLLKRWIKEGASYGTQ